MEAGSTSYQSLAAYQRCVEEIATKWPQFLIARDDRLRHSGETEKVAEAILEDMFTAVLDWSKGDIMYQVGLADIVLSKNLAKYLIIEVKRPGTLRPGRRTLDAALEQARRYADDQKVPRIAASDGRYFYAADVEHGGHKDRIFLDLASKEPPLALWWVSVHGIYRPCEGKNRCLPIFESEEVTPGTDMGIAAALLHPKYQLPAHCFAYVGNANDPHTWKLPYLLGDGHVDEKRLPKAIQALFSNYRGARVGGIPEDAMDDVLIRLARAAASQGRLPPQAVNPAPAYQALVTVLEQRGLTAAINAI